MTEAEQVTSGFRRLKTAHKSPVANQREGNLNLIWLPSLVDIDIFKVANAFIKNGNRSLMQNLPPNSFLYQI